MPVPSVATRPTEEPSWMNKIIFVLRQTLLRKNNGHRSAENLRDILKRNDGNDEKVIIFSIIICGR